MIKEIIFGPVVGRPRRKQLKKRLLVICVDSLLLDLLLHFMELTVVSVNVSKDVYHSYLTILIHPKNYVL